MDELPAINQVLADYYAAFSTLDVQAFLPYFHEPAMLLGPKGVITAPTRATLASAFAPTLESLRARGFGRSELSVRESRILSATVGWTTGVAVRYKQDGQKLEQVGVSYVLHKKGNDWKIAVVILHDPDGRRTGA